MAPAEQTAIDTSPRDAVTSIAIAVATIALLGRMANPGFGLLIFGLGYLLICIAHVVAHRRASGRATGWTMPFVSAIVASNIALICAFVLQWDVDDEAHSRLTLEALYHPLFSPGPPSWLDARSNLAIIAPIASWPLVFASARHGIGAAVAAVGSVALAIGLLVIVAAFVIAVAAGVTR